MKPTSIALALGAVLAAAGAAQAADIQMYGRVDSGLRYTHTKATGDDKLEMRNNRSTPRVGFNIVEDLGNGMKVKAYLENGFHLDTGSLYPGFCTNHFFRQLTPVNPSQEGFFVCYGVFKSVTAEACRSFPRPF